MTSGLTKAEVGECITTYKKRASLNQKVSVGLSPYARGYYEGRHNIYKIVAEELEQKLASKSKKMVKV